MHDYGMTGYLGSLIIIEPLPFLDMIALEQSARLILTDSGGVQKEAFFYQVPCITMRDETEWVETVDMGWNRLVGANFDLIKAAVDDALDGKFLMRPSSPYGEGDAAKKIFSRMMSYAD